MRKIKLMLSLRNELEYFVYNTEENDFVRDSEEVAARAERFIKGGSKQVTTIKRTTYISWR